MSDVAQAPLKEDAFDSQSSNESTEPSAGALLRAAREAAGLHIAALAVALKVPVKKLEALEQDRFDLLPDAVFVRALAASVCRSLKLDPAMVLARLPQTGAPKLIYQGTGINAPFRVPGDGPKPSIWTQISRPAVLAGLVLLLGAVVLIFLPAMRQDVSIERSLPENAVQQQELAAGAQLFPPVATPPVDTQAESPQADAGARATMTTSPVSGLPPGTPPAALMASVAPSATPGALAAATAMPAAGAASQPVAAVVNSIVTFSAKGESWVEVTDAKGVVVLRRTLVAGEVAGASGVLPLAAVVGRADATQVQVRGQAFDLASVSKDNVARFEVK